MRSILTLFVMAAAGFGFILQKKDVPEPVTAKTKSIELRQVSQNNWMKHALDKSRTVAQNVSK
jgi:outer membrane lipopolysaccharide assembly protein LptE/RlpB